MSRSGRHTMLRRQCRATKYQPFCVVRFNGYWLRLPSVGRVNGTDRSSTVESARSRADGPAVRAIRLPCETPQVRSRRPRGKHQNDSTA